MGKRQFNPLTFYRKAGANILKDYVNHVNHPMKETLNEILATGPRSLKNDHWVAPFNDAINSKENTDSARNLADFSMINDLCGERGLEQMRKVSSVWNLQHLFKNFDEKQKTAFDLAMKLFIDHRGVFDEAYVNFSIDLKEGWQIYKGVDICDYKPPDAECRRDFTDAIVAFLKTIGFGSDIHVDEYKQDERLILDIRYSGPFVRQEKFNRVGGLDILTVRKPMDIGLVYEPKTNVLRVKTPGKDSTLNTQIHQSFALTYLDRPEALLVTADKRTVNLNLLKTRLDFTTDSEDEIVQVDVTSIRFQLDSDNKILITNKRTIYHGLDTFNFPTTLADVLEATICFQFVGKGKGRSRTIQLTSTGYTNLSPSARDTIILKYLKRWGILNV